MPDPVLADAAGLVAAAGRVAVLTGAGISTESGIPDFRGPDGLWTRDPAARRLSTLAAYQADPALRRRAWRLRAEHPAWTAEPNRAHRSLVGLERAGRLLALLTQNVDGLHQLAGSAPALVVELHGTLTETVCLSCAARAPMQDALDRVAAGEDDPACTGCGGVLKSATVSFGQRLERAVFRRAIEASAACDLMLVAGSSLTVQPAAGLVRLAVAAGAAAVICNAEPTPYDGMATAVVRGRLGDLLPALLDSVR